MDLLGLLSQAATRTSTHLLIFGNLVWFSEEVQVTHDFPRLIARDRTAQTKNLRKKWSGYVTVISYCGYQKILVKTIRYTVKETTKFFILFYLLLLSLYLSSRLAEMCRRRYTG